MRLARMGCRAPGVSAEARPHRITQAFQRSGGSKDRRTECVQEYDVGPGYLRYLMFQSLLDACVVALGFALGSCHNDQLWNMLQILKLVFQQEPTAYKRTDRSCSEEIAMNCPALAVRLTVWHTKSIFQASDLNPLPYTLVRDHIYG